MALSGIQIYKMLPQTNCKECGFPTCLAFAMKLAAKQVELSLCPYVSEESKAKLSEAAAPPVRPVTLHSNGYSIPSGNEVVLFRHEKRFFSPAGIFLRIYDDEPLNIIKEKVKTAAEYCVDYVGIELRLDGIALQANEGDFSSALEVIREVCHLPLILIGDPPTLSAGIDQLEDGKLLLAHANEENWPEMAALAKKSNSALAVQAGSVDAMVDLVEKINNAGVDDLVLSPTQNTLKGTLTANTITRRMALKKNFRSLGYPILNFPGNRVDLAQETIAAAQAIGKYSSFIVLDHFRPETIYPLLVLRQNIYTDPQKPIQVQPDLYEINDPGPEDPVLVTTNFSITYFSVANEVESAGLPAWLLVCDAEGMSVLTAWAAGKFDAERIAKDVKRFHVQDKVTRRHLILPGHVAVLSGELEEELPGWEITVGTREAVDIPSLLTQTVV